MRIIGWWVIICWIRNVHSFPLPPGDPDTTCVDVDTLACRTCGIPFLDVIAYHEEVSREQARKYFCDPILNPRKDIK